MPEVLRQFSFVDNGRTFVCEVAASRVLGPDPWWWFEVSTEKHQRHAPFRAMDDDTEDNVQERMVAYYDFLLERRAAPVVKKWSRPQPTASATPSATADEPSSDDAIVDEVLDATPDDATDELDAQPKSAKLA